MAVGLNIMNAEEVIKKWVDNMEAYQDTEETVGHYSSIPNPKKRYVINWSHIKIIHDNPDFSEEVIKGMTPTNGLELESTIDNAKGTQSITQKFTARRTESCSEVRFHTGLFVPKRSILQLPSNPGGMELVMQDTGMEAVLEQEMSWQLENTITAGKKEKITVKTTVLEKKWEGNFSVTTKISGRIVVAVYQGDLFLHPQEGDIAEIFANVINKNPDKYANFEVSDNVIKFKTSGFMRCKASVGLTTTRI